MLSYKYALLLAESGTYTVPWYGSHFYRYTEAFRSGVVGTSQIEFWLNASGTHLVSKG